VVAVIAAGPLFVLPVDWGRRQLTLDWNQASRIDWGAIPLFDAGIALGSLMRETGLAKTIGEGLANALNVSNLVSITIISVVIAVIISETTSNTASAASQGGRPGLEHRPSIRRRMQRQTVRAARDSCAPPRRPRDPSILDTWPVF
jgi:H+/gluconate symporter-like permease